MALDPSECPSGDDYSLESPEVPFTQSGRRSSASVTLDGQSSSSQESCGIPNWYYEEGLARRSRPSSSLQKPRSKRPRCHTISSSDSEEGSRGNEMTEMKDLLKKLYKKVEENEKILRDLQNKRSVDHKECYG